MCFVICENPQRVCRFVEDFLQDLGYRTIDPSVFEELWTITDKMHISEKSVAEAVMPFLYFALLRANKRIPRNRVALLRRLIVFSERLRPQDRLPYENLSNEYVLDWFEPCDTLNRDWCGWSCEDIVEKKDTEWLRAGWEMNRLAQQVWTDTYESLGWMERIDKENEVFGSFNIFPFWKKGNKYPFLKKPAYLEGIEVDESFDPTYWIAARVTEEQNCYGEPLIKALPGQNIDGCPAVLSGYVQPKNIHSGMYLRVRGRVVLNLEGDSFFETQWDDDEYAVVPDEEWCLEKIREKKLGRYLSSQENKYWR